MSNQWFKTKYQSNTPISNGTRVGIDFEPLHTNVLSEMSKDQYNKIDTKYVLRCVQANQHNALTSYYYLLTKKMRIQGENLEID